MTKSSCGRARRYHSCSARMRPQKSHQMTGGLRGTRMADRSRWGETASLRPAWMMTPTLQETRQTWSFERCCCYENWKERVSSNVASDALAGGSAAGCGRSGEWACRDARDMHSATLQLSPSMATSLDHATVDEAAQGHRPILRRSRESQQAVEQHRFLQHWARMAENAHQDLVTPRPAQVCFIRPCPMLNRLARRCKPHSLPALPPSVSRRLHTARNGVYGRDLMSVAVTPYTLEIGACRRPLESLFLSKVVSCHARWTLFCPR